MCSHGSFPPLSPSLPTPLCTLARVPCQVDHQQRTLITVIPQRRHSRLIIPGVGNTEKQTSIGKPYPLCPPTPQPKRPGASAPASPSVVSSSTTFPLPALLCHPSPGTLQSLLASPSATDPSSHPITPGHQKELLKTQPCLPLTPALSLPRASCFPPN